MAHRKGSLCCRLSRYQHGPQTYVWRVTCGRNWFHHYTARICDFFKGNPRLSSILITNSLFNERAHCAAENHVGSMVGWLEILAERTTLLEYVVFQNTKTFWYSPNNNLFSLQWKGWMCSRLSCWQHNHGPLFAITWNQYHVCSIKLSIVMSPVMYSLWWWQQRELLLGKHKNIYIQFKIIYLFTHLIS